MLRGGNFEEDGFGVYKHTNGPRRIKAPFWSFPLSARSHVGASFYSHKTLLIKLDRRTLSLNVANLAAQPDSRPGLVLLLLSAISVVFTL